MSLRLVLLKIRRAERPMYTKYVEALTSSRWCSVERFVRFLSDPGSLAIAGSAAPQPFSLVFSSSSLIFASFGPAATQPIIGLSLFYQSNYWCGCLIASFAGLTEVPCRNEMKRKLEESGISGDRLYPISRRRVKRLYQMRPPAGGSGYLPQNLSER
ncbi:hypothetical protein TNCV_4059571 [Trichonephila clavipes]|nr:hypothetical protein TNCV_4059571 [Trichonephila clavipes]